VAKREREEKESILCETPSQKGERGGKAKNSAKDTHALFRSNEKGNKPILPLTTLWWEKE